MQRANCKVRIGGNLGMTAVKTDVSPAEIMVLQHIHGPESVLDIEKTRQCKTGHADELERLRQIYAVKIDGTQQLLVDQMFPGARPMLPVSLEEIGIEAPAAKPLRAGKNPNPRIDPVTDPALVPLTDEEVQAASADAE